MIGQLVDEAIAPKATPFSTARTRRIADAFVVEQLTSGPHRLIHFRADGSYVWRDGNYEAIEGRKVMQDARRWLERPQAVD